MGRLASISEFQEREESESEGELEIRQQISILIKMDSKKHRKEIEFTVDNLRLILPMETCKCMLQWWQNASSLLQRDAQEVAKEQEMELERATQFTKQLLAKHMILLAFQKMEDRNNLEPENLPLLFSHNAITEARNTLVDKRKEKIIIHGLFKGLELWLPSNVGAYIYIYIYIYRQRRMLAE